MWPPRLSRWGHIGCRFLERTVLICAVDLFLGLGFQPYHLFHGSSPITRIAAMIVHLRRRALLLRILQTDQPAAHPDSGGELGPLRRFSVFAFVSSKKSSSSRRTWEPLWRNRITPAVVLISPRPADTSRRNPLRQSPLSQGSVHCEWP
jgi:hypothetical protein